MKYYYDKRINKIITEKELKIEFVAPELYFEIIESTLKATYTEVWTLESGNEIEVVYSQNDRDTGDDTYVRSMVLSNVDEEVLYMTKWIIPSETLKEILKVYGMN